MELRVKGDDARASRRRGCMLALAIGDALGAPVEFLRRRQILSRFGSQGISELEPWDSRARRPRRALPSALSARRG